MCLVLPNTFRGVLFYRNTGRRCETSGTWQQAAHFHGLRSTRQLLSPEHQLLYICCGPWGTGLSVVQHPNILHSFFFFSSLQTTLKTAI